MTKAKSEPTLEKPDIFIPLVIGDYLADTMHLSTEQHGAYLLLLMHYWRSQGPIAASDEACASVVKLTLKEWRKMKPIVLAFFRPGPTDGTLVQKRAQEEIERVTSNKAEASNRGKAGAKARWEDKPGMRSHASGMQNGGVSGCKPDANGMLGDGTLSSSSTPTENLQSEGSQCAREAFRLAAAKLPLRCTFVARQIGA